MTPEQRARQTALAAQATRTAAEQTELDGLNVLLAANPPAAAGTFAGVMAGIGAAIRGRTAAGATVAQLTSERDQARASLATAQADLATARASLATAGAQVSAFTAFFAIKPDSLAGLTADQLRDTISAAVGAAATAQLGQLGIPAAALPAPDASLGGRKEIKELMAEYTAMMDRPAEQAAFYTKHIDPLFTAAAAKAGRN